MNEGCFETVDLIWYWRSRVSNDAFLPNHFPDVPSVSTDRKETTYCCLQNALASLLDASCHTA